LASPSAPCALALLYLFPFVQQQLPACELTSLALFGHSPLSSPTPALFHKERQRRRGVLNPLFSTASLAYMEAWPLLNEAWLHSGSTQLTCRHQF
jgi:hypothetical protein